MAFTHQIFETDRLELASVCADDAAFMLELVNTPGWLRFIGDRGVRSADDAIHYINKILDNPHGYYWVVRLKADKHPIGVISFLKRDYLEHPDIGFAFLPDQTQKGFAQEAAKAVLDYILSILNTKTVLAISLKGNDRSAHLLEKLGFVPEKVISEGDDELIQFVYCNPVANC